MSVKPSHTLYLCYFGLREPLVQTQVLPYLREIKKIDGLKVSLLTFEPNFKEKWTTEEIAAEKEKLTAENINWNCLPYHKRPSAPATVFDILCGAWFTWKMIRREKVNLIHARVHVPAMMGAIAKKFTFGKKTKLLFDIRGFFPEEYTDAGVWKADSLLYKSVKRAEKWLFKESDGFVVLTEKAREILFPESKKNSSDSFGRPVEVIPCCVDLGHFIKASEDFQNEFRRELNLEDRFVVAYVGSFGGWYLTDEMVDFFAAARERNPKTFALILTQRDQEKIIEKLLKKGFKDTDFFVKSVSPKQIPKYLGAADVALSFIKACYSKQSSSPTKIPEYLACGLPIISNKGVGDVDELINNDRVGVILDDFSFQSYSKAFDDVIELKNEQGFAERSRSSAKNRFELEEVGGAKYRSIYRRILNG